MKLIYSTIFFIISVEAFCQNFTINGYETNSIYIGINNVLEIKDTSYKKIVTSIEAPSEISVKKSSNGKFILQVLKPSNQIWVKLYSDNKLIDSIRLKLERISFKQFFKTKDYGLIVSGSYSKEILQNLNSILVKFNAPWIESPVVRFKITIFQEGEVLHENSYDGNYLDDSKIKEAIAKLKTGGIIEISRIKAVLPYDDGDKPFLMQLICK